MLHGKFYAETDRVELLNSQTRRFSPLNTIMAGSLVPPILNPSSLYGEEARRDATRIRIYNNVLQQIYNKIRAIARIPGNEKSLWYLVPEFIPGTPRFDVGDCIVYLAWNLRNAGYMVQYTHPNLMFVSWKNHDMRYKEVESPWAQVLGAARNQVLTSQSSVPPTSVVSSPPSRPRTASAHIPTPSIIPTSNVVVESDYKRKSVLKKTAEYRPQGTTPSVSAPPTSSSSSSLLTGTLPSRHVSFV